MAAVRLFLSYSRQDAAFVSRLVDGLEARGHDTWVDTDDIRGSEPWRASIVAGIRQAEAVVLVISPPSMASANVEREITVAREHHMRVVPAVLEPAPLRQGLEYDLAGVQQVALEPSDADASAARLDDALRDKGVVGRAASAPTRKRPRWLPVAIVAALAVALLAAVLARRGGDDGGSATATVTTAATTVPAAEVEPLDARLWFAGFEVLATEARYEPASGKVEVDLDITNTQRSAADATTLFVNDASALVRDGHRTTLFCPCPRLPPGTSGRVTATASVAEGFALDGAVLEFGAANQHQAMLPVDGSPATSERPVSQPLTGLVDDGQVATFTVEQVEVVPAACYGLADGLQFVAGPKDRMALVIVGSVVSRGRYPVNFGDATLRLPDGATLGSSSLASATYALNPGAPQSGVAVCFDVAAPAGGQYGFAVTAAGVQPRPSPFVFEI
jgi:hypothetical protein